MFYHILLIHFCCCCCDGHCYFQLFSMVTNAGPNIGIQVLNQVPAFDYFGYILRSGLLRHMVTLCLIFWGTTTFTTATEGLQLLHILTFVIFCFVDNRYSNRYDMVLYYVFYFHFLNHQWCGASFHRLLIICISSFWEMSI